MSICVLSKEKFYIGTDFGNDSDIGEEAADMMSGAA